MKYYKLNANNNIINIQKSEKDKVYHYKTQEKNKTLMISLPELPAHQIQMQNLFPLIK